MKKIAFLFLFMLQAFLLSAQEPTVYITSAVNSYSVIEGDTYTFTVSMYSATTTDVIVDVETIANTADATDYTPLTTTITIPAGQLSSNQLTVSTNNDLDIEKNESFIIEASITSNNTENTVVSRSITLWDNDRIPALDTWQSRTLIEGEGYMYSISLSNYYNEDVIIEVSTITNTADDSDYIPISTSLTIPAGELDANYSITTLQDDIPEEDETFTINFAVTSENTVNEIVEVIVTIRDNDTTPTLSFEPYHYSESNPASVRIRMDRVFNSDVVIQLETSNGTADNSDYTTIFQTKTIQAGYDYVSFQIPIIDDDLDESRETINFAATVISDNTTNTSGSGAITIIDNDGLPDFYLDPVYNGVSVSSDVIVVEEGFELKFKPRLTHASNVDTHFQITTTNGTADNSDYTTSTITGMIPAGQTNSGFFLETTNFILSYPTILDQLDEDDETMFINAIVSSDNTYNSDSILEGLILDNYNLNAQRDEITLALGVGGTYQLMNNDTFEGLPVDPASLNVSLVYTNSYGITLDANGLLTIPSDLPLGEYNLLYYEVCQIENPSICDSARIDLEIVSPLAAEVTITYNDFNGDGYTSVGDIVEYDFVLNNIGNTSIANINAGSSWPEIDIVGGPLMNLGDGQEDTTTFTATHVITQNNINFGYCHFSAFGGINFTGTYYGSEVIGQISPDFCIERSDGIKLNAFVDANANGTQESDEVNFPLGQFNYEINNDGIINNLYVSPHYLYESNPTTTYDLSYTIDLDYTDYYSSGVSYTDISVLQGSNITTYDFPITVMPYDDLSIDISASWQPPRSGFEYWNFISYTNNSNEAVNSGMIEFVLDDSLSLLNVYEASNFLDDDSLAEYITTDEGFLYNFNSLQPFETKNLWVRMQVPTLPTVSLGQLVTNTVDIELLAGDIIPLNNTSSLTQTIVGSYDPNDITEKHGEEIVYSTFTSDDYLTYTIRFENIGTANAINVRIEDVLDEQLDESTLKMIDASHTYSLERVGKHLEWNFAGIDLPPSENDVNSQVGHGFITFKIKPFLDYEIGDVIPNTAEIYFDFNPAIITNTWTTTFVESLNINESELFNLKVYPNPTKHILQISNNSIITSIEINSIEGKKVFRKSGFDNFFNIDVSELTNGVYFMRIKGESEEKTIKFIKE